MENTTESAKSFLTKYRDERTHPVSVDYFAEMMVDYASACSAPSSIGEDVIRNKYPTTIAELGRKPDDTDEDGLFWYNHLRREGAKWAISRLSERKIVLPSERKAPTDADMLELGMEYGWNDCIKELKNINSIE